MDNPTIITALAGIYLLIGLAVAGLMIAYMYEAPEHASAPEVFLFMAFWPFVGVFFVVVAVLFCAVLLAKGLHKMGYGKQPEPEEK